MAGVKFRDLVVGMEFRNDSFVARGGEQLHIKVTALDRVGDEIAVHYRWIAPDHYVRTSPEDPVTTPMPADLVWLDDLAWRLDQHFIDELPV